MAAIRASAALPGFITPVVIDGRLLADGGLTNPLPIAPTSAAGADLTVAVVVVRAQPDPRAAPLGASSEHRAVGRLIGPRLAACAVQPRARRSSRRRWRPTRSRRDSACST